ASSSTMMPPPTCIAPIDTPSSENSGMPKKAATISASVTLMPTVRAKRVFSSISSPSTLARKIGIMEAGSTSASSVTVFLSVSAPIDSSMSCFTAPRSGEVPDDEAQYRENEHAEYPQQFATETGATGGNAQDGVGVGDEYEQADDEFHGVPLVGSPPLPYRGTTRAVSPVRHIGGCLRCRGGARRTSMQTRTGMPHDCRPSFKWGVPGRWPHRPAGHRC